MFARVALEVPISAWFDYAVPPDWRAGLQPFDWVWVPWGKGRRLGLFLSYEASSEVPQAKLKTLIGPARDAPAMPASWQALVRFASRYYHRSIGEIGLPAIPKPLRQPGPLSAGSTALERAQRRARTVLSSSVATVPSPPPALTPAQQAVLATLRPAAEAGGYQPFLLFGVTGSGKTEVYLAWFEQLLARHPRAQVLLMVPEISLTPRLVAQVRARFPEQDTVVLHSGLADMERSAAWLTAAQGRARIVIGTRLSVLTPLPGLAGIVVDEEHDPSFKQPDAAFSSARDLALALGSIAAVPVLLASATPSLESWQAAAKGRYQLLRLPERATGAAMPQIRLVKPAPREVAGLGLSPASAQAIEEALARDEQVLVFLNRRGYAPVLYCMHCGWLSQCSHCSAYRVLHKIKGRYRLICHHCSQTLQVPRQCPQCGATHLEPLGQGTQAMEESLARRFPGARIRRVDRDVAQRKGAVETIFEEIQSGEADLLLGTQMLAKGHDFPKLRLVVVLDCDGALYSGDFRARERLFATLMQVAGRAGRAAPVAGAAQAQVIIETRFHEDPMFAALRAQDYEQFAAQELAEREGVGFPPFCHQALLRARSPSMEKALDWLARARALGEPLLAEGGPVMHDPVPMPMARLANQSRAQLLIESPTRPRLHAFLRQWLDVLRQQAPAFAPDLAWQLEMDPLEI